MNENEAGFVFTCHVTSEVHGFFRMFGTIYSNQYRTDHFIFLSLSILLSVLCFSLCHVGGKLESGDDATNYPRTEKGDYSGASVICSSNFPRHGYPFVLLTGLP
jgi:hypothetical protein